jgi:hypothetical protein
MEPKAWRVSYFTSCGTDVRFGSKADMGLPLIDVRFTPNSGHRPAPKRRVGTAANALAYG